MNNTTSHCLNPDCQTHQDPNGTKYCQTCGIKLLLNNRYLVTKLLGEGGFGKTFLAVDEQSGVNCVIKQLLPKHQGNQKAKELFEREATQLAELGTHPQIPSWFDYFEQGLEKGGRQINLQIKQYLYIAIELIEGQNLLKELENSGKFTEKKIREFLKDILPVIKFIHDNNVIHRDIKPENIMRRNSDGKLVLIDFGGVKEFTQTNMGETGLTGLHSFGYAPNEQMRGKVYPASDLYCLGATCIHLLTGIHPCYIYDDVEDRLPWREALAKKRITISSHLIQILDKLLKNLVRERYQSADEVLKEFIPEVRLSQSTLIFTATKIDEILTHTIRISNSIPDTLLEGRWEVAPHPHDPPHTPNSHAWISFSPANFASNQVDCKITVNTSKLQADQAGERQILLHTNSSPETYTITVKIQTAPLPIETQEIPYGSLLLLGGFSGVVTWLFITTCSIAYSPFLGAIFLTTALVAALWGFFFNPIAVGTGAMIGTVAGSMLEPTIDPDSLAWVKLFVTVGSVAGAFSFAGGYLVANKSTTVRKMEDFFNCLIGGAFLGVVLSLFTGFLAVLIGTNNLESMNLLRNIALALVCTITLIGLLTDARVKAMMDKIVEQGLSKKTAFFVLILTIGLGISIGAWLNLPVLKINLTISLGILLNSVKLNIFLLTAVFGIGLPLASILVYPPLNRRRLIAKYQQSQQHLIKP